MALEAGDASVNRPAYTLTQGGRCRTVGVVDAKANKQSGTEREQECWGTAVNGAMRIGLGRWSERVREKSAQSEQANHLQSPRAGVWLRGD